MLTPDFGTVNNLFKMASNGEVTLMKEFRIVDMNIFEVWAIIVRFHLKGRTMLKVPRSYIRVQFGRLSPQDDLI